VTHLFRFNQRFHLFPDRCKLLRPGTPGFKLHSIIASDTPKNISISTSPAANLYNIDVLPAKEPKNYTKAAQDKCWIKA
jgi:hypothetical protein